MKQGVICKILFMNTSAPPPHIMMAIRKNVRLKSLVKCGSSLWYYLVGSFLVTFEDYLLSFFILQYFDVKGCSLLLQQTVIQAQALTEVWLWWQWSLYCEWC